VSPSMREWLLAGQVIPAHPLALTPLRGLDERHQRALTRYYCAAGVGGVAVGVHTTGFPIHDEAIGLYRPVLELAWEVVEQELLKAPRPFVRVAGVIGDTRQAVREATIARELGYQCVLLSLGAWRDADDAAIIAHCRAVGEVLPLFGFYLQPAVGGRRLERRFWREFAELPSVVAIKIAPFDRYATLDVVRAVADAGRDDIALYTGNDDSIIADLLTPVPCVSGGRTVRRLIVGGLLGQWAVWTRAAVEWLDRIKSWRASGDDVVPVEWLAYGSALTQANAAIFDAANEYAGCLPGILEVLRHQGLVRGTWTLDPHERLSDGQAAAIHRISREFPELGDTEFVAERLDEWLR
jgi:dihydrodipicolinate synthase/N-acetylneuraminate lyase